MNILTSLPQTSFWCCFIKITQELSARENVSKGHSISPGEVNFVPSPCYFFRYYFKKVSDEFDCGVVFEEVREDDAILPIFEEKIIGKVEKIDWNVHVEDKGVYKASVLWTKERLDGEEEVF